MKTASRIQPHGGPAALRRHIRHVAFQRRQFMLLSRMGRMGISPQTNLIMDSLVNARNNAGLLSAIATHFNELAQSGVVDPLIVESFSTRLRVAAKIYTTGQHTVVSGRVCVMGNATVTAVGSLAHVKAAGRATVILQGATAVAAEGVCVVAHAGSKVRRFTAARRSDSSSL